MSHSGPAWLGEGAWNFTPPTSLPAASLCHPATGTLPQPLAGTPACPLQSPPRSRGYRGLLYREAIGHVWRCGPEITGSQRWPEGEAPHHGAAQRMRQQRKRGFTDERPPPSHSCGSRSLRPLPGCPDSPTTTQNLYTSVLGKL